MRNKQRLFAICSDILIVLMVIVSLIILFVVGFPSGESPMALSDISALKYYTIDSNILMGVSCLISLIYRLVKKKPIPLWILIIKFVFVTAVMVTCLTTLCYLLPYMQDPMLVTYANIFLHIATPLVSLVQFLFIEDKNEKFTFKHTLFSMSSLVVYGTYYLINIAVNNGYGNPDFDWYGFGRFGLGIGCLLFVVMIAVCWGISLLIYLGYKKVNINFKGEVRNG